MQNKINTKKIVKKVSISPLIAVIFFVFSLYSCNKEDNFGYEVLPDQDKIHLLFSDTTTIYSSTHLMDTLVSSSVSVVLLGNYTDPLCGKSSASFVTQFAPDEAYRFLTVDIPDSVVLVLPLRTDSLRKSYYGDISVSQTINVYGLKQQLSYINNYYSHKDPTEFNDGVIIGTKTYKPYFLSDTLKITLKKELSDFFLNAEDSSFVSPANFFSIFSGVYVEAEDDGTNAAIVKIDKNSGMRLEVYYHKESSNLPEVAKFSANITECATFNLYKHQYQDTDLYNSLCDESKQADYVYIQEMGGLRTKLQFPFLSEWKKNKAIVIKRAVLIIETADNLISDEQNNAAVEKILLTGITDENGYYLLPEYNTGSVYSGVDYNIETKQYRFDIAAYLTEILSGKQPNNGVYLFSAAGKINFNRSVIDTKKIRLAVTYLEMY